MDFCKIIALLITTTAGISAVVATGNGHEDVILASIAALASSMNEKFERLELKVNQIIVKQNHGTGCSREEKTIGDSNSHPDHSHEGVTQPVFTALQIGARLNKLDRLEALISELVSVPACQRTAASIPQPMIFAALSTTQNISCQAPGHQLNSCVWGRRGVNGTRQAIIVDGNVVENNGMLATDRVSYLTDKDALDGGNCRLSIESVLEAHAGLWSCTLLSKNSTILSGAVHVALSSPGQASEQGQHMTNPPLECESYQIEVLESLKKIFDDEQNCAPCPACDTTLKAKLIDAERKLWRNRLAIKELHGDIEPSIYYPGGNSMQAYSLATSRVKTVGSIGGYHGVAYDPSIDKLYWSTDSAIFRGERNGTGAETLLSTTQYGRIFGLDVDWITGNVYGSTLDGKVFVCSASSPGTFPCAVVLSGLSKLEGIALDPSAGLMYLTEGGSSGSIRRAGMDGTSLITFVTPVDGPRGIAIDFKNSRLYWASEGSKNVQHCDFEGTDIQTAVDLGSRAWGLTVFEERIFVGNSGKDRVESYNKAGQDMRILSTESSVLMSHLVGIPRSDLPETRTNHCKNRACSSVCVLARTSFSCLS